MPERTSGPTPASGTRERIIEAAARVFSQQGYARATTRGIAADAGITEVTLFRHFGSKQNLFAAVIEQHAFQPDGESLPSHLLSGDYHEDVLAFGRHMMRIMLERREAMRMMLCEAAHFPELQETLGHVPRKLRDTLAAYLRQRVQAGYVVPRDPDMMAQAFLGFFFSYTMALGFLDQAMALDAPDESLLTGFVDLFVQGTIQS